MNIFLNATAGVIMVIVGIACLGSAIGELVVSATKPNNVPQVGDMYAWIPGGNNPDTTNATLTVIVAPPKDDEVEHVYVFVDTRGRSTSSGEIYKTSLSLFTDGNYYRKVLCGKGGIDADILSAKPEIWNRKHDGPVRQPMPSHDE